MPSRIASRLNKLEQKAAPPVDDLPNDGLLWVMNYGLLEDAVIATEQRDFDEVCYLVALASDAANRPRTEAQIEWCVQKLAKDIAWYRNAVDSAKERREREKGSMERQLRADAAHLVKNRRTLGWPEGPALDEEQVYAESLQHWRERDAIARERIAAMKAEL